MCYQFLVGRNVVQYNPIGVIVLYNRVYECISTMYTDYTNNYDTSHVAYPEGLTVEEQQAKWAIFAALQPPRQDVSATPTNRQASTTIALHTYSLKHIPSYIFPSATSSHHSAPTTSSSRVLPSDTLSTREPKLQRERGNPSTELQEEI